MNKGDIMKKWRSAQFVYEDGSELFIRREDIEKAEKALAVLNEIEEGKKIAQRLLKVNE
jgi:hypothetical protein